MINCVSACLGVVPHRTSTQLMMYDVRGHHTISSKLVSVFSSLVSNIGSSIVSNIGSSIVSSIVSNISSSIISNIFPKITHFVNRLMQHRQVPDVFREGSIQCSSLVNTGRNLYTPVSENTSSEIITNAKKNERYNHHDNLAQVRKSEKTLQYSNWCETIEAVVCDKFGNINCDFYQMFGKSHLKTSTHMTYGRDNYFFNHNFRNSSINDNFFKVIYVPMSRSFMPTYFLNQKMQTQKRNTNQIIAITQDNRFQNHGN